MALCVFDGIIPAVFYTVLNCGLNIAVFSPAAALAE
jgi:hypothetical protein